MKKRTYLILAPLLLLVIISVCFLGTQNRKWEEVRFRKIQLKHWQRNINEYLTQGNSIPDSLYQYCVDTDTKILFTKTSAINESDAYYELIADPNLFYREVPYRFLKGDDNWYVMEIEGNKYFKGKFMIDKDGKIYTINLN